MRYFSLKASQAVENIAEAVTHAKFVGSSDTGSDEVVLLKILQVVILRIVNEISNIFHKILILR